MGGWYGHAFEGTVPQQWNGTEALMERWAWESQRIVEGFGSSAEQVIFLAEETK